MAIDPTRDPHARIVTKPLPSQIAAAKAAATGEGAAVAAREAAGARAAAERRAAGAGLDGRGDTARDPFLRAANEDDDGYDPYSDRPAEREPLFQEDPWA